MKQFLLLLVIISTGLAHHRVRRIVGGQNANPGQFPYMVSLQKIINNQHFCGGSILNERYILTAAHCVINKDPKNLTIFTGSNILDKGGQYYLIDNVVCHPDYDSETVINDIAIIKVDKNITFNNFTQPIPLVTNPNQIPCNTNLTVSGWGRIGTVRIIIKGNETVVALVVDTLQFFEATQMAPYLCNLIFSKVDIKDRVEVTDGMICAMTKSGQGICNGDSGSPAVYNGMLVGIASWAFNCALGIPEGYTNVTVYSNWIQETMAEMDFLPKNVEDKNVFYEMNATALTDDNTTMVPPENRTNSIDSTEFNELNSSLKYLD